MKKIISLLCAVVLSFLHANGITFLFERPVGYSFKKMLEDGIYKVELFSDL